MNKRNTSLVLFVTTLTLILLGTILMNMKVDISGQRTSEQVRAIALSQKLDQTILASGRFDQRSWVETMLLDLGRCPETLVLGSSTVGLISKKMLNDVDFMNAWLTGPTIEDMEAIVQILDLNKCAPKKVWIGIDPWFFNSNVVSNRWFSIYEYELMYKKQSSFFDRWFQQSKMRWLTFRDLLSFTTTLQSVQYWQRNKSIQASPPKLIDGSIAEICSRPDLHIDFEMNIREYDGHFDFCANSVSAVDAINQIARTYLKRDPHQMHNWPHINVDTMKRFRTLLQKLRQKSKILIVAPPYHPLSYEMIMSDVDVTPKLLAMDNLIGKMARDLDIPYANLRNPLDLGCNGSEFVDSHHANSNCVLKFVSLASQKIKN